MDHQRNASAEPSGVLSSFPAKGPITPPQTPKGSRSVPFRLRSVAQLRDYVASYPSGTGFSAVEDVEDGRHSRLVEIKHILDLYALLKPAAKWESKLSTSAPVANRENNSRSRQFKAVAFGGAESDSDSAQEYTPLVKGAYGKCTSQKRISNYITTPGIVPTAPANSKTLFRVGDVINALDITRHDPNKPYLSSHTADIVATTNAVLQTRRRYMIVLKTCGGFMVCAVLTRHGLQGLKNRSDNMKAEHMAISPHVGENRSAYQTILQLEDESSNPLDVDSYVWLTRTMQIWYTEPGVKVVGRLTSQSIEDLLNQYCQVFMHGTEPSSSHQRSRRNQSSEKQNGCCNWDKANWRKH
ncbi:hypothetical protein EJ08DRAFT_657487 [Tothia fuscella]|uniref:Uncharacterized protein n=1 Tax=Tothia fuscella TaxID=1048955 RepID=A0A9P4NZM2_9PEZI|nr:hypothetical protein EJ08DRAFT_657487 [Tothia fuscella]